MSWIDRTEALRLLGVKPQSLYAYVSRGLVAARPSLVDARASLYSSEDVAAILQRRRTGRRRRAIAAGAIAWGDAVMETRLTTVREGRLFYCGKDAVDLSGRASLEEVAALLWGTASPPDPAGAAASGPPPPARTLKARGLAYLSRRAAEDAPVFGRARADLAREAWGLLRGLCDAFVCDRDDGLFHQRLAARWSLSQRRADDIRRALVLVADHELNPSTFAARVAASTGASLAACALAGYATLTGPLHGEASARAVAYLRTCLAHGPEAALSAMAARQERVPATGHTLYQDGDPRAAAIFGRLRMGARLQRAIAAAEAASGAAANIDMAFAAMTVAFELPDEAPFALFAGGRMAGWLAHAMEQSASGRLIRPRAAYVGP